jgi:hypothetical protein
MPRIASRIVSTLPPPPLASVLVPGFSPPGGPEPLLIAIAAMLSRVAEIDGVVALSPSCLNIMSLSANAAGFGGVRNSDNESSGPGGGTLIGAETRQ